MLISPARLFDSEAARTDLLEPVEYAIKGQIAACIQSKTVA
jgi:hypothetical protein